MRVRINKRYRWDGLVVLLMRIDWIPREKQNMFFKMSSDQAVSQPFNYKEEVKIIPA